MKHFLLTLPAVILLFASFSQPPLPVKSIQPLQDEAGKTFCTVFSINQAEGYWATAEHCVEDWEKKADGTAVATVRKMKLHGKEVKLIFTSTELAVIQSPEHAPAIGKGYMPSIRDHVIIYGYLWGSRTPTWFEGAIGNPAIVYGNEEFMVFDSAMGPGQSGSPVMDSSHRVISVALFSALVFTGVVSYAELSELDPYWAD